MRYVDGIISYLTEDYERKVKGSIRRQQAKDVRSGKMSSMQRVARIWSDARRRGDTERADQLLRVYKKLEAEGGER